MQSHSRFTIHHSRILPTTACLAFISMTLAYGQQYPVKPVRIVSPFVAGGPGDLLPRGIAASLSPILGQQVIVENRPGGSQIIGMQLAAKSPSDGYTLLFATVTGLATNVSAFR